MSALRQDRVKRACESAQSDGEANNKKIKDAQRDDKKLQRVGNLPAHFPPELTKLRKRHDTSTDFTPQDLVTGDGIERCASELQRNGYIVVRGLLNPAEVESARSEITNAVQQWGPPKPHTGGPPPYVDFDPSVTAGTFVPASKELGVRRLFHIATNNDFFRKLCLEDERLVLPIKHIIGRNLKLVQSMALMKPPGTGEKRWHQDQAVFRLHSKSHRHKCVLGWWIALDSTDADNGCMHLEPGSNTAIVPHDTPETGPTAHIYFSAVSCPDPTKTVYVPMEPGDAMLFDVSCVHGTPANATDRRRRALQMQYAPSDARPTTCPQDGSIKRVQTVGRVFNSSAPAQENRMPFFDCELAECVEPQFWSFRKAEAHVCGENCFHPECI